MRTTIALATIGFSLMVAGCGGGGGGGGGTEGGGGAVRPSQNFKSFRGVGANESTQSSAVAQRIDASVDDEGQASSTRLDSARTEDVSVTAGTDARRELTTLTIRQRSARATWGDNGSDALARCDEVLCTGTSPSSSVIYGNPEANDWEYQTYGLWLQQDAGPNQFAVVLSMGAATAGASIPTQGTATYLGNTLGVNAAADGEMFAHSARLRADVDFAARRVEFSTFGTQAAPLYSDTSGAMGASHLDLNGTLVYAPGVNSFSGAVTSAGGMSGTASGRFYGPEAQEIGGVYGLTGAGPVEKMTGSFGGKAANH